MHATARIGVVIACVALACGERAAPDPAPPDATPDRPRERPSDTGEALASDLVPTGTLSRGTIGSGHDALDEQTISWWQCLVAPATESEPVPASFSRFSHPMSAQELIALLGFEPGTRQRFELAGVEGWAGFARPGAVGPLSVALYYGVEVRASRERLAVTPATAAWAVDPAAPDWRSRCGDVVISEVDWGGQVFLLFLLDFADASTRAAFETVVGTDVAAWDLGARLHAHADTFDGRVQVSTGLLQRGGEVAALVRAAPPDFPNLSCGARSPEACDAFVEAAMAYALDDSPQGFAAGVRERPAHLRYRLAPWSALGLGLPEPRAVPDAVDASRAQLLARLEAQLALYDLVRTLERFERSLDRIHQLDALSAAIGRNLAILREAADVCWDLEGPEDAAGVARCAEAASATGLAAVGFDESVTAASIGAPAP